MFTHRGQSIIEYTMIVGIITVVLYFMGTGIKRGVQSVVKVTADQIGNQQNSDQEFNDSRQGFMMNSQEQMQQQRNRQVQELGYVPKGGNAVYLSNTAYNEYTDIVVNTITNGGFSPNQ